MESASTISWVSTEEINASNRLPTATPKRYERHKSAKTDDRRKDPLMLCIELNYIQELQQILDSDGQNFSQDRMDQALLRAASCGKSEACKLLVQAGSDPNAFENPSEHQDRHESSGLFPFLPEHGQQDSWIKGHTAVGGSVLHRAIEGGHIRAVQIMLHLGSNVNSRDRNGLTPLMLACIKRGNLNMVHLLTLIPGCDIRAHEKINGKTALHFAAEAGDAAMVKMLLENGANVDDRDAQQNIPLNYVLMQNPYDNPKWPQRETTKCVQILLEYGSYVNAYNNDKTTPIHVAVSAGLADEVELMLQKCAVVSEDTLRKACLHVKHPQIVAMLLGSTHTFEDSFLCVLLIAVISTVESKWVLNARLQEEANHNIAKSLIKAVSDSTIFSTVSSFITKDKLITCLDSDSVDMIDYKEVGSYGLLGYAIFKGKFGIARMLCEVGCRDKLSRLKCKPQFLQIANEHAYLRTWLPQVLKTLDVDNSGETVQDQLTEDILFLANLDLDKKLDVIEPFDDNIHDTGYGMIDVNYTAREDSKAYLASNVLIYS